MSVSLLSVLAAAKTRVAPLAGESAGYLVLAVADQIVAAPRLVAPESVELQQDGSVRTLTSAAAGDQATERSLRALLDSLLLCSSSGSAALMRAGRRPAGAGVAAFVREIEAALIPVNRGAARRALARLYRETSRALDAGLVDPHALVAASEVLVAAPEPNFNESLPEAAPSIVEEVAPLGSDENYLAVPIDSPPEVMPIPAESTPALGSFTEAWQPAPFEAVYEAPQTGCIEEGWESVPIEPLPEQHEPILSEAVEADWQPLATQPPEPVVADEPIVVEWVESVECEECEECESESQLHPESETAPHAFCVSDEPPQYSFILEEDSILEQDPPKAEAPKAEAPTPEMLPNVALTTFRSDVSELAESFGVRSPSSEPDVYHALRQLAGLDPTPGPSSVEAQCEGRLIVKAR